MTTPGERAQNHIVNAIKREMKDVADDLHDRAVKNISVSPPPDEDPNAAVTLAESGSVSPVRDVGDHFEVDVTFDAIYAAAQHEGAWSYLRDDERVVAVVKKHPGGGRTKYLEAPLKEMVPAYRERLAKAAREADA